MKLIKFSKMIKITLLYWKINNNNINNNYFKIVLL